MRPTARPLLPSPLAAYVSCPLFNNTCVTASAPGAYDAPVHISIGNAGQGLTAINNKTFPSWVKYQRSEWGYSLIHLYNSTHMSVDLYDDEASESSIQYSAAITRKFPRT